MEMPIRKRKLKVLGNMIRLNQQKNKQIYENLWKLKS